MKWISHHDQRQFIPGILGWFNFQKPIMIHHINRINDKTCMIIPIDEKETFDKSQNPFIIKNTQQLGIKGSLLNLIKGIYEKHTTNTKRLVKDWMLFPPDQGKTRVSALAIFIRHYSSFRNIKFRTFRKQQTSN